jgi:hypothetical protein
MGNQLIAEPFSFERLMESIGFFLFEPENGWTNEDWQQWFYEKEKGIWFLTLGEDNETIKKIFPLPTNLGQGLYILKEAFEDIDEKEIEQEYNLRSLLQ